MRQNLILFFTLFVPAFVFAQSTGSNLQLTDKGLVNLDFVNTEIAEIAKTMGELTERNFIIDDKVRGKITIISPRAVSIAEAYQAFISALEVKNFTVVRVGKMHKIVPLKDTKKLPVEVDVEYPAGGGDEFVTRLVPVQYTKATELQKSLRNLISKDGDIFSYEPTNTLIITDSVVNIRRLIRIIQKLDQQGFAESIHVIKLRYATAADTAKKITDIFDLGKSNQNNAPNAGAPAADDVTNYISKIIPDDRTNSLIVVANDDGLAKIKSFVQQIDQSLEDQISTGRIHVHYLQYADAVELAATLGGVSSSSSQSRQSGSNRSGRGARGNNAQQSNPPAPANSSSTNSSMLGGEVEIVADEHTNALIITASPADFESLLPVINKLDIRRPQAFVEAMIMEVDIDKASEVGVAANGAKDFKNGDVTVYGGTQFGDLSSVALPLASQGLLFGVQGDSISVPIGGGENLDIPIFGGIFRALQTDGTINVLSTPNILTRDNMEAEIIVGRVVPFITTSGRDVNNQPINQIQRENVALTLRVTPQINASDELTMDIFQEIQDLIPGPDINIFGPTTSTRSAKTTVLVKDGQTVTIGGLISDRIETSNSKVPILGDAPLIGWLFRNRSNTKTRQSLVMFLTPHIIRTPEDLEAMTLQKNEERRNYLKYNHIKDHPGVEKYKLNKDFRSGRSAVPQDSPSSGFMEDPPISSSEKEE
ncbi:MAG: type II secretion system secretin GspD [Bdellovibrionales bacterium]|nr:type II secretion system secretin GspD [Bdellovibrionales bacterium]